MITDSVSDHSSATARRNSKDTSEVRSPTMFLMSSPPVAGQMLMKVKLRSLFINSFMLIYVVLSIYNQYGISRSNVCSNIDQKVKIQQESSLNRLGPNCVQNPYTEALEESLAVITNRSEAWLNNLPEAHQRAVE